MRKLKERLLEQIRLRDGAPPSATAPEATALGGARVRGEASAAQDHFAQCDASLQRVQAAMVAWAGALDALGACTQAMAEELARHTMLVAQPTDPCAVLKGDRAERESAARCCRALQSVMTAVDRVVRPVHGAFLAGALRPLMAESQAEAREVREMQEEYRRRATACRRGGADGELAPDLALVCNSTGPTTRQGRAEFAERALTEAGELLARRIELFRRRRAERVPEEIGTVLGCQLELSRRMEAEVAKLVPLFPHAASAMVDIALASTERPDGRESPRPTAFDQRSHVSLPASVSVPGPVRAPMVVTAPVPLRRADNYNHNDTGYARAPTVSTGKLLRPIRGTMPLDALESDSDDEQQDLQHDVQHQDAQSGAQQDLQQDDQPRDQQQRDQQQQDEAVCEQRYQKASRLTVVVPPVPRRLPVAEAGRTTPPLPPPSDASRGYLRQGELLENFPAEELEREQDNELKRTVPKSARKASPKVVLSDVTNAPRASSLLYFPGYTCGELLPPAASQGSAPRETHTTNISFGMLHEQFRVLL